MRRNFKGVFCLSLIICFFIYGTFVVSVTGAAIMGDGNDLPETLIPGGNVIGVKLYTQGVHVVGITSVDTDNGKVYPGRQSGLKEGDFITKVNGESVDSNEEFAKSMQTGGDINITVHRGTSSFDAVISPAISKDDGLYRAGLWVRDSTAGIGTITFYDPQTQMFGALGHGITDQDTGKVLTVKKGYIYNAYLTSIRKGEKGKPGELNGIFANQDRQLGDLQYNTEKGIFGKYENKTNFSEPIPVGGSDFIKEGKATIYSSIEKDEIKEYEIEIIKIIKNNAFSSRGMIIRVTDPELLEKTHGIVQGMSGSPIIQNGHIVGAVTHVFVNDPTQGYGIFIGNMLSQMKSSMTN